MLQAFDLVRQQQVVRRRLFIADTVVVMLAWLTVLATAPPGRRLAIGAVAAGVTVLALTAQGFYRGAADARGGRAFERIALSVACGLAAGAVAASVLRSAEVSTERLAVGAVVSLVAILASHGAHGAWLRANRVAGRFRRPVVLIGGNDEAAALADLLSDHPELGLQVLGVICPRDALAARFEETGTPWLGDYDDTLEVVARTGVSQVVIAGTAAPYRTLQRLARELPARGVEVQLSAGVAGVASRRMKWQSLAHEPILSLAPASTHRGRGFAKRAIDLVVAVGALLVLWPLLLAIALAVKLGDRGPVLFAQERVGRGGQAFRVYKFRTMVPDAERVLEALRDRNQRHGPLFKLDHDPRVTFVGRFLRQTSLDELPQLVNVLKGEMSIVGPRPPLASEVAQFDEELRARRFQVRPGITGLWQIEARDNPAFGAYRRLDLFYVDNWSLGLDLMIMWSTLGRVARRAVRAPGGGAEMSNVTVLHRNGREALG